MAWSFGQAGDMFKAWAKDSERGLLIAANETAKALVPPPPQKMAPENRMLAPAHSLLGRGATLSHGQQVVLVMTPEQLAANARKQETDANVRRAIDAQNEVSRKAKENLTYHANLKALQISLGIWKQPPSKPSGRDQLRWYRIQDAQQNQQAKDALDKNPVHQAQMRINAETAKKQEDKKDSDTIEYLLKTHSFLSLPYVPPGYRRDLKATIKHLEAIINEYYRQKQEAKAQRVKRRADAQQRLMNGEAPVRAILEGRKTRVNSYRVADIRSQALAGLMAETAAKSTPKKKTPSL